MNSKKLSQTYVIAEMACAHDGNPDLAYKLIDIAATAHPDAIQLQIFSVDRLVSPLLPSFNASKKLEIPLNEWPNIISHSKQQGLQVWANIFDEDTLEIAAGQDVDGLKLHSSDLSNHRMLDAVGSAGKPVNLAVGGSTLDEIAQAVFRLRERGTKELILMHGYQGYPTHLSDARLGFIKTLMRLFGCPVGYQDHTDGSSELAIFLPLVAIGAGACVLEKHFTDDRFRKGTDYESALGPEDFTRFVRLVRATDITIGEESIRPMSEAEFKYRHTMKKTIVAACPIRKGEKITDDMLAFMRAEPGLTPWDTESLIGKLAAKDILIFATIRPDDLIPDLEDRE